MNKLKGHKIGLAVGGTVAVVHALWAATVGIMPEVAQKLANFDMAIHFMSMPLTVQGFTWGGAIGLVIFTFCVGYVIGRIFATVYNSVAR